MYLCGIIAAMPVTFWDRFFDTEYRQRTDIGALQDSDAQTAYDVQTLARRVDHLETLLAALMKVMSEMGQLDPRAVKVRVEAELEAMRPPAPVTTPTINPAKTPTPSFPVKCDRCGNSVPSTRTTITEAGTLCDKCAP
jgi:hypothetical protein